MQTLGPALLSLSGRLEWEHGSPAPDEENTVKFLYAALEAGMSPDAPPVAPILQETSRFLATHNCPWGA